MKRIIEHPVISAVLAGLILSGLAWFGGFLPVIWSWIVGGAKYAWNAAIYPVPVPAFIVTVVVIFVIVWLYRHVTQTADADSVQPIADQGVQEEDNELQGIARSLSNEEHSILDILVQQDGNPLDVEECRSVLRLTNLQTQQILESLIEKQLILVRRRFGLAHFYLTRSGRDIMLMGNLPD